MILQLEGLFLQHWLLCVCFWLGHLILLDSISLVHWWNGAACPLLLVYTSFLFCRTFSFSKHLSVYGWQKRIYQGSDCKAWYLTWHDHLESSWLWEKTFSILFYFVIQSCHLIKESNEKHFLFCYLYFLYKSSKTRNENIECFLNFFFLIPDSICVQFYFMHIHGISHVWWRDIVSDNIESTTKCICFQSCLPGRR